MKTRILARRINNYAKAVSRIEALKNDAGPVAIHSADQIGAMLRDGAERLRMLDLENRELRRACDLLQEELVRLRED